MAVVFDASFLVSILDATVKLGSALDAKLAFLLAELDKSNEKIVIPTPALSEVLVGAGEAAPNYLAYLNGKRAFEIVPFDQLAAIEAADAMRIARLKGDKRGGSASPWQKVKFDQQIVAIARVKSAKCIYSNDADIEALLAGTSIAYTNFDKLPFPPEATQGELPLA